MPEIKTDALTIHDRLAAMRNLPAFFKLLWEAGPVMTVLDSLFRVVRATLPFALLYIGKMIVDQVVMLSRNTGHSRHYLWQLVAIELALAVLADTLSRAILLIENLLSDLFSNLTSVKILAHAATLDLDQYEDSAFYDKLERARKQAANKTILLTQVMTQVQDIITMVVLSAGLVIFNPWLILLVLIAVLPAFLGESYFNNKSYALARSQTADRREMDYFRYLGASDETAKEIKIFDLSGFIIDHFRTLSARFYNDSSRLAVRRAVWAVLFALIGTAGYYFAYVFIILKTITGTITIGEMTFLAGSFMQLRMLLETILNRFTYVSQDAMFLRDYFDFFKIKPKINHVANPLPFPDPIKTGFTFEDVSFKYTNAEHWAVRHITFTLQGKEKLALVGENGAGKTTLVKLLARLYDPTEGRILLDGVDLKEYDLTALRMRIGIIFQDYMHYQMSFAQNIAVGNIKEKENQDLIRSSAYWSLADTLAEKLPGKYDQPLGRRFNDGIELSGGEWQKIALARAYMHQAELLILDEPTSAMDAKTESEVFQRFAEVTKDRAAVLLSHRFSTVRIADRIMVLQRGEICEMGTHEELLQKNGHYAELFHIQAEGYR